MAKETLTDQAIVELYFARNEAALQQTAEKYGRYLYKVAWNILYSNEDAEESVNDTYMDAWGAMPPHRPSILSTFLAKITRRIAIDRVRSMHAKKREGSQYQLSLEEWKETLGGEVADDHGMEALQQVEAKELGAEINAYLAGVKPRQRQLFVRRYFYMDSMKELAETFGLSEANVKTTLFRMRKELAAFLGERGYEV